MECLIQSLDYTQNFKCCRSQAAYKSSGIEDNSPGDQGHYCSYLTTGRLHSYREYYYLTGKHTTESKKFSISAVQEQMVPASAIVSPYPGLFIYFLKYGSALSSVKVHLASTSVYIFIQGSSLFIHLTVK